MAGGGGQQERDSGLGPLWISIGLILIIAIIWYNAHQYIVAFVFHIKLAEAHLIAFIDPNINSLIDLIKDLNPTAVDFKTLSMICTAVGKYYAIPVAIILFILAPILYLKDPTSRFKQNYSMQRLAQTENKIWPQITPIMRLNLIDANINKGPWAMALQPKQFAEKYNMLRVKMVKPKAEKIGTKMIPIFTIDRGEANRIFSMQLGRYWEGIHNLPIHIRALFACFAARINHDIASSHKLLMQISASTTHKNLNFAGADALLKKYENTPVVEKITKHHAYVSTVMASMLEASRADGVMATADFLWLKPTDRTLWFLLNNIGRQTAFPEVAGIIGHWLVEKELQRPLFVPVVNEAVNALDEAVGKILYDQDHDQSIEEMKQ